MIKVCAIFEFKDLQAGVYRKIGDRFEVNKERYFEIIEKGGDWIVAIKDIKKEDIKKEDIKKEDIKKEDIEKEDIEKDDIEQKQQSKKNKTTKKINGSNKGE
ncbi:hypothetical protein HLB30_07500 [Peptostreptococcus russellii]|uniref:hypothetical protein n=1 Tax=Peptostreptococcus russellii TaxID=215200 RepID=UPI00162817DD|nr:hypothetical protein [Peptostreptococcus russellii]MBC2578359.1 hypothetical protein [Peptostreptococcus russellii]